MYGDVSELGKWMCGKTTYIALICRTKAGVSEVNMAYAYPEQNAPRLQTRKWRLQDQHHRLNTVRRGISLRALPTKQWRRTDIQ